MTTIAANRKVMACDGRITGDVLYHAVKIKRIGGSLYGVAGDWEICTQFFEWLETDRKEKPALNEGAFEAIELNKTGLYQWLRGCFRIPILDRFYACGSGAQGAMCLMSKGYSPLEAIRCVAEFDETTGPPFKEYSLVNSPAK